jgi:hypothetical protein
MVWKFDNHGVRSNFNFELMSTHVSLNFLHAVKTVLADCLCIETSGTTKQRYNSLLRVIYTLSEKNNQDITAITAQDLEYYFAKNPTKSDYHLDGLFQRWIDLELPFIKEDVLESTSNRTIVRKDNNHISTLHPTKGPYLDSEIIAADLVLKNAFETGKINAEDFLLAMTFRLYGQRPVQVANLKISDVRIKGQNSSIRTEIRFPLAKKRNLSITHGPSRPTPMLFSKVLESYIMELSENLPEKYNNSPIFIPKDNAHPRTEVGYEGHNSASTISSRYSNIMKNLNIISPRTGKRLYCNATRDRHTAATLLAMKGCSAEEIAAWLHHDDVSSCEYYVELGVRHHQLMHSLLDGRFTHLAGRFFGEIINDKDLEYIDDTAIITDNDNPEAPIIGGCSTGGCNALDELAAPFACLNGCPHLRLSTHANLRPLIESIAEKKKSAKAQGDSEYHESLNRHLAQIVAAENALRNHQGKEEDIPNEE